VKSFTGEKNSRNWRKGDMSGELLRKTTVPLGYKGLERGMTHAFIQEREGDRLSGS